MSDTVPGAIIMSSQSDDGLAFLPLSDPSGPADAVHVNGGAYTDPGSTALQVEFCTLAPDLQPVGAAVPVADPPVTVSGSVGFVADQAPDIIAGALQQTA